MVLDGEQQDQFSFVEKKRNSQKNHHVNLMTKLMIPISSGLDTVNTNFDEFVKIIWIQLFKHDKY